MSKGKFIVTYLAKCAADEVDPRERAKEEIAQIDVQLKEADKLRCRRSDLVAVLDHVGDHSYKRQRVIPDTPPIELADDTEAARDVRRRIICRLYKEGGMTVREIIQAVGSYREDARVIRQIKFLGERGVVRRDEEGRVIPGPKWNGLDSEY
jgi:hypothetical protein